MDWLVQKKGELERLASSADGELAQKRIEERIVGALSERKANEKIKFGHSGENARIVPLKDALFSDAGAKSAFSCAFWKSRLAYFAAAKWENGLFVKIGWEGENKEKNSTAKAHAKKLENAQTAASSAAGGSAAGSGKNAAEAGRGAGIGKKAQIEISIDARAGGAYYVLALIEKNADVEIFVRISGGGENAGVVEACLEENAHANISIFGLQHEGSAHFLQACGNLQRDAKLRWFVSSFGGEGVVHAKNTLVGEGAGCENFGAFFPKGKERLVVRTATRHIGKATFGNILTKAALMGESVLDYRGGVRIEKGAVKSESDLNSKNIMLSDRCRVDAIPFLEIETNDVKASHGTSVGQLDDEELFYLKSRGLSEEQARRLVAGGFFTNILEKCAPNARQEIEREIKRCLDAI